MGDDDRGRDGRVGKVKQRFRKAEGRGQSGQKLGYNGREDDEKRGRRVNSSATDCEPNGM